MLLSNTGYSAPPVIANWSTTPGLGRHLLNTNFPLPALHRQVPIDPAKLSAYSGRYPLTPRFVLTVTPRDGRLIVQATGQNEYEVFPESDTRFFYRVVDAQITFELAPDGTASALVLRQNGRDRRGDDHPEGRADIGFEAAEGRVSAQPRRHDASRRRTAFHPSRTFKLRRYPCVACVPTLRHARRSARQAPHFPPAPSQNARYPTGRRRRSEEHRLALALTELRIAKGKR